ncbi:MAG: 4-hydroxythreonine-4-phosphate dehydrogenase PdxA [Candidatus Anammoxibacter sp.]
MKRPLIGITMGDPCGIGPEIILKAISSTQFKDSARFLIIGSKDVLCKVAARCNMPFDYEILNDVSHANQNQQRAIFDINNFQDNDCFTCKPTPEGGKASIEYICKGIDLAMKGSIDALVTAPINKEAIKLGGYDYPGHTELLTERTRSSDVSMLMVGDKLRVGFVTSHIALREVPETISTDKIAATIKTITKGLKEYFSIDDPRVAVCGLNPHSGEAGRFGGEEEEIIIPAVNIAKDMGIDCSGPVPADVVFFQARKGLFDAVIALYHDQGAIPLKLLAFETGVNITLGIPIIRTSPDHGTAYDIAGKCVANPDSMIAAIRHAIMMANS